MSRNRSRLLLSLAGLVIAAVVLVLAVVGGTGINGKFYTPDHYASFKFIVESK